jgi:hypothetical protein
VCGGFIHRDGGLAVARDVLLVSERVAYGLAEADADILNRVVVVYINVAGCLQFKHVREKRNLRVDRVPSGAVNGEVEADVGFGGCARNPGRTFFHGILAVVCLGSTLWRSW